VKVTLFVPTLNEEDGIRVIMPKIKKEWCDQILIADGQSTDRTVEEAQKLGYEVYVQKKKGIRNAYIEAWPLIRGDVVITFSPDGNCIVEDIPALIAKMKEGFDMVIASRYYQNAKSEDDTIITRLGNFVFTSLINMFHCGHYTDALTIYRAYRTKLFYELDLHMEATYAPERFFLTTIGVEPVLSIRAAKKKMKIAEIPSDEPARMIGEKKLQIFRWGASYLAQIFRETYYWKT